MESIQEMYDLCVFKGCPNGSYTWGTALFPFPQRTNPRYKIWLENCGNKSIIGQSEPALRKFGLCSDHFTPDSFYDEEKKNLRIDAVPEPYSPTFKRLHFLTRANTRIYDHNYALIPNETDKTLPNYKRTLFPLRRYNAKTRLPPPTDTANSNQGNTGLKTTLGSPRLKRERSLLRTYGRKNLNGGQTAKASSVVEFPVNTKSAGLKTGSRLTAGAETSTLTEVNSASSSMGNISANRRGRRAARGGGRVQGNSLQAGGAGFTNREIGILQETNNELRTQNKLLRRLNGQLKLKMKRCEDRNLRLKSMLEKVSSIDGFLDLHRCGKTDVRNLIKQEIHKCKITINNE